MKGFLKKKLPAALLALAMMVSLVPAAFAAKADFTFEVEAGESAKFSRADIKKLYDSESNDDFGYLAFTKYDKLDDYGLLKAKDSDGKWVTLDEDDLEDTWFYYDTEEMNPKYDCQLKDLTFVADEDADEGTFTLKFTLYGLNKNDDEVEGIIEIEVTNSGNNSDVELTYKVEPDDDITFDDDDFEDLFEDEVDDTLYRLEFTDSDGLDKYGTLYIYDNEEEEDVALDQYDILKPWFYLKPDDDDDYRIKDLSFEAFDDADGETVTLEFTLHGEDGEELDGVLYIEIGDGKSSSTSKDKDDKTSGDADLTFTVDEDEEVSLDRSKFRDLFEKRYDDFYYLRITKVSNLKNTGYFYSKAYDKDKDEYYKVKFDADDITDGYFYYDKKDVSDKDHRYTLSDLTFVADDKTDGQVVSLDFTLYGEDSGDKVSGTLEIEIGEVEKTPTAQSGDTKGNILYLATYNNNVQLNANDFARYLKESYPSSNLQYVKINGVPSTGGLYYNYYGASTYGTAARTKMTASTCDDQNFYLSPADSTQYALTELTYVPSGTNYCAPISFTAYGTGSRSVTGTVLISVSMQAVSEIYGVVPKNTAVSFPAPSIVAAVVGATAKSPASIQLLKLPESTVGSIYVGTGTTRKADTSTLYSYADTNSWQISQLRFVPASSFTGSVEIPYVACDSNGNPMAVGKFCLGIVSSIKKFSDVTSTTWCYKYITELASAGVISGYTDGTYKFNNTVTYGAALKLVMLAAGYGEQAPTDSNVFSGYLAKARAEGIVTRTNVDLTKPITRLQVAQLAAGALKLDINSLSSIKPFTDTSDLHVQALNAAGIVEGYFSNGTSTYKPTNTVTRGQLSAIVWRMQNYTK